MRSTLLILFFHLSFSSNAQVDAVGTYHNFFGSKLNLFSDSSYKYSYRFDLSSSWSIGEWRMIKDTLILINKPIYDTIRYIDTVFHIEGIDVYSVKAIEELILSQNEVSENITRNQALQTVLSGGGQNRYSHPNKLLYKKGRLYEVSENGKIKKGRKYCPFRRARFKVYYVKE